MISGLTITSNYITEAESAALVRWIDAQPWSNALRRRTQHFGYRYSYDRRPITREQDYLGPLPGPMANLAMRLAETFGSAPDQAIVNEYLPGQGISTHIDHVRNFGPVIASLSLLSDATMIFERAGSRETVDLHPRDLLIMRDDARYHWTHAIPRHIARRLSVTFRSVRLS